MTMNNNDGESMSAFDLVLWRWI